MRENRRNGQALICLVLKCVYWSAVRYCVWLSLALCSISTYAQNQDTCSWRLGVSGAFAGTLWSTKDLDLWSARQPLFVSGFYHHSQAASDSFIEGRRKLILPGLILRNDMGGEWGISVAWIDYQNTLWEASYPARLASSYRFVRLEHTRTTRPGEVKRPRFGLRWGLSLLARKGYTTRDFELNRSWMRSETFQKVEVTTVMLQPTVSFGYRSGRLNAGLQLYWNLAALVQGKVIRDERRWIYGEGLPYPVDVDEVIPVSQVVFVDRLAQWGLLWSNIQVFASIPLIRLVRKDEK